MKNNVFLENLESDMVRELKAYMETNHIKYSKDARDERILLDFIDNRKKWVLPRKRDVILSAELEDRIESHNFIKCGKTLGEQEALSIIKKFDYIRECIENGRDINYHLSKKIFSSDEQQKDTLLNTWNVKHIHLSEYEAESKSAMKRNRSDFLLFCIITNDSAYCIDILEHPKAAEFSMYRLMLIILRNGWSRKIGFMRNEDPNYIPDPLQPKIENDKDITAIYQKCRFNMAFEFDGKMYMPFPQAAITCSGDNIYNVQCIFDFREICSQYMDDGYTYDKMENFDIDNNKIIHMSLILRKDGKKYECRLEF